MPVVFSSWNKLRLGSLWLLLSLQQSSSFSTTSVRIHRDSVLASNEVERQRRNHHVAFMTHDSQSTQKNSTDDEPHEEDMMASPEMVVGITTHLSEETTASTELALSQLHLHNETVTAGNETVSIATFDETTTAAAKVIGEKDAAPDVKKILKFAIPAIGVWLCSPLLSLIDTSAVGLLSGTAQQAALNPAVAVTEYAALLIAFMYTATTNLVASAKEKDRDVPDKPITTQNFVAALQLSGFVGTGLGAVLFSGAVPILRAIIGNDAIPPEVFTAALRYVRIRALGMPAAAIIGCSQAACLGMQDIKSPLYVLVAAAVINLVGDLSFVGNPHPWIGGAAGAAWATVFSQYAAVFFFIQWLCHFPKGKRRARAYSARGFLEGKFRGRHLFKLPSKSKIEEFTPYIVPVTSTQVGRVSSYVAMSHVISSSLGTVSMAAQQVILSLWNCLYPVGESLSLTAQSFVPSIVERKVSKDRANSLRHTLFNFWKAGAVFGTAMSGAVLCIPFVHGFFTADRAVAALVDSVVPLLVIIFSTLGIFTASEGVLLGQKDLGFLGKSYATFFFVVPYIMLRVKKAAQGGAAHVNLKSVWTVFTAYQMFRTLLWILRTLQLQRRTHRKAQEKET